MADGAKQDMGNDICDSEVQHFMQDYIQQDRCICRKYRKLSSSKRCPYCLKTYPGILVNQQQTNNNRASCSPANTSPKTSKMYTTDVKSNPRTKRKRKPKLIPATDYIAKYYFPYLMRYENLTLPSDKQNQLIGSNTSDRAMLGISRGKQSKSLITSPRQKGQMNNDSSRFIKAMANLSI